MTLSRFPCSTSAVFVSERSGGGGFSRIPLSSWPCFFVLLPSVFDFTHSGVKKILPSLGATVNGDRALKAEVDKEAAVPTYSPEDLGLTPLKKRDKLRQGEKLVVCSGSQIGLEGEVLSVSRVFFFSTGQLGTPNLQAQIVLAVDLIE